MEFRAEVRESLTAFSDAELDRVTARASIFFDRRWFRLLDALDLPPLLRGEARLRYAVIRRGAEPVAVCPFLVTRSPSIYWAYSFDRFFFTGWQEQVLQFDPVQAERVRRISRVVHAYRSFARATGARTEGWVLAVSPLSYRGGIAVAAMAPDEEREARAASIRCLQDVAQEEELPLCFSGIEETRQDLRESLVREGFEELFLSCDNLLPLIGNTFEEYLAGFDTHGRRCIKREMRQVREAGVRFEVTREMGRIGPWLEQVYHQTYSRYGEEHFPHPASFWAALEQHVAPRAEVMVAYQGREPIGFTLLLHTVDELWCARVGRSYDDAVNETRLYFNLAYYETVRRAMELGAGRVWLGPGHWETKRRRGARLHRLYSYMWFPGRWSRAVLGHYVRSYSQTCRKMFAAAAGERAVRAGKADTKLESGT